MTELQATLLLLGLMAILAFWKPNPILFMVSGGVAMMSGLYWFDIYTTNLGMAVGMMLIAFSLYSIGMAFRLLFWNRESEG